MKKTLLILTILIFYTGCSSIDRPTDTSKPTTEIPVVEPAILTPFLEVGDTERTPEKIINTLLNNHFKIKIYEDTGESELIFYDGNDVRAYISYSYDYFNYYDDQSEFPVNEMIFVNFDVDFNGESDLITVGMSRDLQYITVQNLDQKENVWNPWCTYDFITEEYTSDSPYGGAINSEKCDEEMVNHTNIYIENYHNWLSEFGINYDDIVTLAQSHYFKNTYDVN